MNKEERDHLHKEAIGLIRGHVVKRGEKMNEFVKVTMAILTTALALIVGLQSSDLGDDTYLRYALLSSISLLGFSVLFGLAYLLLEAKSHGLAAQEIKEHAQKEEFDEVFHGSHTGPWYFDMIYLAFPYLSGLSILSLCVFGIMKNI